MEKLVIFIHSSGWRTGSTYFWSKFRNLPEVTAFYEPFNQVLSWIKEKDIPGLPVPPSHPRDIQEPYFEEYKKFIKKDGGVELFRHEFAQDNFFENDPDKNRDIENYLKNLIEESEQKNSLVFAFNRSIGRLPWLKKTFPSINIFQYRNPRDQWVSIRKSNLLATNDGLVYETYIFDLNKYADIYKPLKDKHFTFDNKDQLNYFFFCYLQNIFQKIGLKYADITANINELSSSPEKREEFQDKLHDLTGLRVDFSDISIKEYSADEYDEFCFPEIEEMVFELTEQVEEKDHER